MKNPTDAADVPVLIQAIFENLNGISAYEVAVFSKLAPAVSIKRSVRDAHIACLEDGKKLKTLKRHLATAYGMTPEQYRAKWGLPGDYPMVVPAYARARKDLALKIGLGRKGDDVPAHGVAGGGPRALMRAELVSRAALQAG